MHFTAPVELEGGGGEAPVVWGTVDTFLDWSEMQALLRGSPEGGAVNVEGEGDLHGIKVYGEGLAGYEIAGVEERLWPVLGKHALRIHSSGGQSCSRVPATQ